MQLVFFAPCQAHIMGRGSQEEAAAVPTTVFTTNLPPVSTLPLSTAMVLRHRKRCKTGTLLHFGQTPTLLCHVCATIQFSAVWSFPLENIKDKNISGVTSDNIHSRDTSDILVVIQNDCYGTVSKGWLKSKELQCECVDLHIETSTDRANKCNLTETKQKGPWASWIISL